MQSPLTPQRGRIESNPREYTHMECPACDELEVMPLGSRCVLAVRDRTSVEIRMPAAREWIIGPSKNPRSRGGNQGKAANVGLVNGTERRPIPAQPRARPSRTA